MRATAYWYQVGGACAIRSVIFNFRKTLIALKKYPILLSIPVINMGARKSSFRREPSMSTLAVVKRHKDIGAKPRAHKDAFVHANMVGRA